MICENNAHYYLTLFYFFQLAVVYPALRSH